MERTDRRRAPRVDTDLIGSLGETEAVTCRVANLSKSGALAISSHPVPELAQVRIRLQIPHDETETTDFTCEAAVVRCDRRPDGEYDLGLFFTALGEEARAALDVALENGYLSPTA